MKGTTITQLVALLLCLIVCANACFLRMCPPPSGKRAVRQCPKCGPKLEAQCLSSEVCCSGDLGGCYVVPADSPCRKENKDFSPCSADSTNQKVFDIMKRALKSA